MQPLYKPEKTWGNYRPINANHRGNHLSIYTKTTKHHSNIIPTDSQWICPSFPTLEFQASWRSSHTWQCRLKLDDLLDDSPMDAEPLSLQIFKELLLLLEVPRKILRLLTTNLNQLVINLEVRVSCNMCFLFMGHGSSCIMMNEEFSTAGARSGSNSFV